MNQLRSVLVTGVSGGLGNSIALTFLSNGYRVIGIDIAETDIHHDHFIFYKADITDYDRIKEVKSDLSDKEIEIQLLINNAGVFRFFPVSDVGGKNLEKYFGINTIAPFHLIHCFLDDLINNKGRVIQVSSENVKVNGIFQPYPASKIALEALGTAARQELKLFDIKLIMVRPGAIDTQLLDWKRYENKKSPFYPYVTRLFDKAMKQVSRPISPEKVAKLILKISQMRNPRRIYQINNSLIVYILSLLPRSLQDWIMVKAVKS